MFASTTYPLFVDRAWPVSGKALYREIVLIAAGAALIAAASQLVIPLPFSPVPVTGQTLAVLIIGALYGSLRGPATVMTYIAAGVMGAPVFAAGGFGIARLAGPTGGYLMGFILAAALTGFLAERGWDRSLMKAALAMLAGNVVIYATGLLWLGVYIGFGTVLALGLLPFIIGDIAKIALAASMLPAGWKLLGK